MMNLNLLYWASKKTGDPRFEAIARIHADTTIREFIRKDGSSNHIVIFDPKTAEVLDRPADRLCARFELEPRTGVGIVWLYTQRHQYGRSEIYRRSEKMRQVFYRPTSARMA